MLAAGNATLKQLHRNDAGLLLGLMCVTNVKQSGLVHACAVEVHPTSFAKKNYRRSSECGERNACLLAKTFV